MGLFFTDVKNNVGHTGHILINTADKNKSKYTIKEYSGVVHACAIQDVIERAITKDYIEYIEDNLIPNSLLQKWTYCPQKTFLERQI